MQETARFDDEWRSKVAEYETALAGQMSVLRQAHEQQLVDFEGAATAGQPQRPQYSGEYLEQRRMEERLVKQVGGRGWRGG